MEDSIEICSGCGKMPRSFDRMQGSFICSRCGNRTTIQVTTENYEKVATELDQNFHANLLKEKHEGISKEPIPQSKKSAGKSSKKQAKKSSKKPVKKAKKPMKKSGKSKKKR